MANLEKFKQLKLAKFMSFETWAIKIIVWQS